MTADPPVHVEVRSPVVFTRSQLVVRLLSLAGPRRHHDRLARLPALRRPARDRRDRDLGEARAAIGSGTRVAGTGLVAPAVELWPLVDQFLAVSITRCASTSAHRNAHGRQCAGSARHVDPERRGARGPVVRLESLASRSVVMIGLPMPAAISRISVPCAVEGSSPPRNAVEGTAVHPRHGRSSHHEARRSRAGGRPRDEHGATADLAAAEPMVGSGCGLERELLDRESNSARASATSSINR